MKNIILIGASRAGKTTFAGIILKELGSYQYYNSDTIVDAYGNAKIEVGKRPFWGEDRGGIFPYVMMKHLYKLMSEDFPNLNYLFDLGNDSDLSRAGELMEYSKEDYVIIAFGYPNITAEDKVKEIRKYEQHSDWTKMANNVQLLQVMRKEIAFSKRLEQDCYNQNIKFVDTSFDREQVLHDLLEYLKEVI